MGNEPISIAEYGTWTGALANEDAHFISANLRDVVGLRSIGGNLFQIVATSFVGRFVLPSGQEIRLNPKVPVRSVLQMIALVLEAPVNILDDTISCNDIADGIEIIADWFASNAEGVISRGLMRRYIEVEDRAHTVRGRIDLAKHLRVVPSEQHRIHCRFSELTWDIPENQVIKQCVRVLHNLPLQKNTSDRLRTIDSRLAELSVSHFAANVIDRFAYDRSNDNYRAVHRLCGLILRRVGITEDEGLTTFPGFFIDMNALFEAFVTRVLEERMPAAIRAQRPLALCYSPKLDAVPDLSFAINGSLALIGDCKYKRVQPDKHIFPDMYQAVTYCVAAGVSKAVLIYPRAELPVSDSIEIRNSPIVIRRICVDLSLHGDALVRECDRLATTVSDLLSSQGTLHVA